MAEPVSAPRKEVVFEIPPAFYLFADGSVERCELRPPPPPSPHDGVAFKDLTLNADLGLWARLYLPHPPPPPHKKLPLVLFIHGGGFILGSPAQSHSFCVELAKRTGAIWFSASYRLAPEHRLPAAFDDGFSALQWLHSQSLLQAQGKEEVMEGWLASADFSKCFVVGVSAGGNIAHRVTMRALNEPWSPDAWAPLRIRGLIPIHAGFARNARPPEEEDVPFDPLLNWHVADMCFKLGLPEGTSSRDDPMAYPVPELLSGAVRLPPKVLVALAEHDVLHFVGQEYVQALKQAGCSVDVVMSKGVGHCFFSLQPHSEQAEILYDKIVKFISDDCLLQKVCGLVSEKLR